MRFSEMLLPREHLSLLMACMYCQCLLGERTKALSSIPVSAIHQTLYSLFPALLFIDICVRLPLSLLHVTTGAVSFGQIVKAGEPVFAAATNALLLGVSHSVT